MFTFSRRSFLKAGSFGLTGALLLPSRVFGACKSPTFAPKLSLASVAAPSDAKMAQRFVDWLRGPGVSHERAVKNMVFNFYDTTKKKGHWIYPMLSGKAILWLTRRGNTKDATAMASSLLRWQQTSRKGMLVRSYGAFPSQIKPVTSKKKGPTTWSAGERYYAGDNLVILQALVELYEKTKDAEVLNAAIGIGSWLVEVMCKGHKLGMWKEDHGAPMQFVTDKGDFNNQIHGTVAMLWIGALDRLGRVTGEPAYCAQSQRAYQFFRGGQLGSGAFLDHYDPGFPAKKYDSGNWKPYQPNQVISDNVLRSALGACRMGDLDAARKFYRWLKVSSGAVPAYLDLKTGLSGFPPGEPVYYDVTSSALHRSLALWLGERKAAEADLAFLRKVQHKSGSWYWGLTRKTLQPRLPQLAPIVGFWATADLSVL